MSPALVASDLDRTLIYSAPALALDMPDATAPRLLCVEIYDSRPLSYMTETAARLLARLAGSALFVPATTRTPEQYLRVRLPTGERPPRYAVCANGGRILVDGEPDADWDRRVRKELADGCAPLAEVRQQLVRRADPAWLLKERTAEDLFAYLVVDRSRLPAEWVAELTDRALGLGWTVSLQGRKLYAVPVPLTKSAAVAEVARRAGTGRLYTAGDSLLDTDLLLAGDEAWRPGHGELADSGWDAAKVNALPERGVLAGERILRAFLHAVSD
ncbi:HAD family hydrolase [Streptomyces sp. TP-A0874]|uniref:HAD family hydrolase n=1 Tax=Streptomyces sp. TP-A0874 TaxID=549819 RepID=UPI0008535CCA|nr:HAD family hydrolase [Streptomyces sp. TP-A0874]